MQKIATRVFIIASLVFGILGITMVLLGTGPDKESHGVTAAVVNLFLISIFVILTSFALSVAAKYLNDKS